jgi:5'(3')-deoxyribonucleotidase
MDLQEAQEKISYSRPLNINSISISPNEIFKGTTVYFDFDDVVADLTTPWLDFINKEFNSNFTKKHVTEWGFFDKVASYVSPSNPSFTISEIKDSIFGFLDSDIYKSIKPNNSIIDVMKKLNDLGFNLKILSAGLNVDKLLFIEKYLPFLEPQKSFIFSVDKSIVREGILIDDRKENCESFVDLCDISYSLMIKTFANSDAITNKRISSHDVDNFDSIFNTIVDNSIDLFKRKTNLKHIIESSSLSSYLPQADLDKLNGVTLTDVLDFINSKPEISNDIELITN